jgi:polyribonucleotide nucleotidyltransferase
MNKIETLKKEIEAKQEELEKLEEAEKLKEFQEFTFKSKKFKIYKWENKPYEDLINNLPKNERLATFQEFNEAVEEKAFEMEIWKYYITKHFNKLQWDKIHCLSRCYRDGYSNLNSNNSDLSGSIDSGRVVIRVK